MKLHHFGLKSKVALGLVLALLGTTPLGARAAFTVCRSDPSITLSNGAQVTLSADIFDDPADVQDVHYELHGPTNTSVANIQYDQYASLESFTYVPDERQNRYRALISIHTGQPKVAVLIQGMLLNGSCVNQVALPRLLASQAARLNLGVC